MTCCDFRLSPAASLGHRTDRIGAIWGYRAMASPRNGGEIFTTGFPRAVFDRWRRSTPSIPPSGRIGGIGRLNPASRRFRQVQDDASERRMVYSTTFILRLWRFTTGCCRAVYRIVPLLMRLCGCIECCRLPSPAMGSQAGDGGPEVVPYRFFRRTAL